MAIGSKGWAICALVFISIFAIIFLSRGFVSSIVGSLFSSRLFASQPLPLAPELFHLNFERINNSSLGGGRHMRIRNSSTHDVFFRGNPPANVLYDVQVFDNLSGSWNSQRKSWVAFKMESRLLKVGEIVEIEIDPAHMTFEGTASVRLGIYVRWNPEKSGLNVQVKQDDQFSDGWVYIPLQ